MAEEIIIGKLIIDTSDLESSMASSKKAIVDLENEQKKLKKDTEGLSSANEQQLQTFVDNELQLKKIKAEYAANQKSVLDLTKAQTNLDASLSQQNKTQAQAIENTKALTIARRQIDATTTDGAKAIADINTKIDANNKFVAENGSQQEKAATITGNYRQKIFDLGNAFGGSSQQVIGFVQQGQQIISSLGAVNTLVTNTAKNIIGFGNASKVAAVQAYEMAASETVAATATETLAVAEETTTVATSGLTVALGILLSPVTLIIAAIGLVVFLFKDLDPLLDKIEQGFAAIGAGVDVLRNSILAFVTGTKSLAESFGSMGSEMSKAASEAVALKEAQQDLADAQRSQEVSNAKASQQYDELILKSKNRTLTEKERISFLNQAQKIEEANFKQRAMLSEAELANAINAAKIKGQLSEQEIANLKKNTLAYGNYLLNTGKITEKELENIKKAELGKIEIKSESTRRLEKSQNAEDKLADDAKVKAEKRQADAKASSDKARAQELKDAQNRIDILKAEGNARNLDALQRIALAQKIFDAENALAQKGLGGSDLSKQLLTNRQNLSSAILAITEEQISKEGEAQKRSIEQTKAINAELYDSQSQSANDLATAQLLLLNKKVLSEKDYANEVIKINQIKNESLTTIQTNFDEAEKVRRENEAANAKILDDLQFQIRLQDITDRDATEQEIKRALLQENYSQELALLDENLASKKLSEEAYRASINLADKKYAAATKSIDKQVNKQKRDETERTVANGLAAAGALFEGSKAVAVATSLFNTYQGITAELSTKAITPYEIGLKVANVAFVAAAGFAAVKNILKTDKGSSSVDAGSTKPQTTSGTASFVNTAQTETVARVSDTPQQQNTLVTPPVLILESLHEAQNNLAIKVKSN